MKRLFLAVGLFIGLLGMVGKALATDGYYTTASTAVCITTGSDEELLFVEASSGSSTMGATFIVIADSNSLTFSQTLGASTGTLLRGETYDTTRWPASQYITPPIVVYTTATYVANSGGAAFSNGVWQHIDFRDQNGSGRGISRGLVILMPGTNTGTVVTVGYRKRKDLKQ